MTLIYPGNENTSLYRTLLQVPKVTTIEGFHCIKIMYPSSLVCNTKPCSEFRDGNSVTSVPGSHPAFRRLQYGKALFCSANDEKLDESLGPRLAIVSAYHCPSVGPASGHSWGLSSAQGSSGHGHAQSSCPGQQNTIIIYPVSVLPCMEIG